MGKHWTLTMSKDKVTPERFGEAIADMAILFGQEIKVERAQVYYRVLKDFNAAVFEKVVEYIVSHDERFPVPYTFIETAGKQYQLNIDGTTSQKVWNR